MTKPTKKELDQEQVNAQQLESVIRELESQFRQHCTGKFVEQYNCLVQLADGTSYHFYYPNFSL